MSRRDRKAREARQRELQRSRVVLVATKPFDLPGERVQPGRMFLVETPKTEQLVARHVAEYPPVAQRAAGGAR